MHKTTHNPVSQTQKNIKIVVVIFLSVSRYGFTRDLPADIGVWPNGKATDFDSVYAGSIPATPASTL